MMNTVVIGIGSPILSDGAAPLKVIESLRRKKRSGIVTTVTLPAGGFDLLTELEGHGKAIIIAVFPGGAGSDVMMTESVVGASSCGDDQASTLPGDHGVELARVLDVGRTCGYTLPGETVILGIRGADVYTVGEKQTGVITETVKKITQRVEELLEQWDT